MRALSLLALTATVGAALLPSMTSKRRRPAFGSSPPSGRGFSMSSGGGEGGGPGPNNPCMRLARLMEEQGDPEAADYYNLAESPSPAVLDQCVVEIDSRFDYSPAERSKKLAESRRRGRSTS